MADLTPEQIHTLQHSIGISDKAYEYRNRYCCDASDEDVQRLVRLGMMEDRGPVNVCSRTDYRYFAVTEMGKKEAWQHKPLQKAYEIRCRGYDDCGPSIYHGTSAGKAKYDALLSIRDIDPDVEITDLSARRCPQMDRKDPAVAYRVLGKEQ